MCMGEQAEFWFDPGTGGQVCLSFDLLENTDFPEVRKYLGGRRRQGFKVLCIPDLKKKWHLHIPTKKRTEAHKWKNLKFEQVRLSDDWFKVCLFWPMATS